MVTDGVPELDIKTSYNIKEEMKLSLRDRKKNKVTIMDNIAAEVFKVDIGTTAG